MTDPKVDGQGEVGPRPENTMVAVLCYVPLLFFLPRVAAPDDGFARYHGRQSLVLFLALVAVWVVIWFVDLLFGRMIGSVILIGFLFRALAWLVHNVVGTVATLCYFGMMIAGMVQAASGNRWTVPLLGGYASRVGF